MKKIICLALVTIMCLSLGGCYDSDEISKLAFIIAVGIDKSDDGMYEYTFQTVKPSAFDNSESDAAPLAAATIKAPTIYAAMDKLDSEISEKCDYSHIKLAVFSEELMKTGAESIFRSMLKSDSFHPNTRVAMSETKASEYLQNIKIPLDTNPAEYYENIFKQDYTAITPDTRLRDMEKSYINHPKCNILPIVKASVNNENEDSKLELYNTERIALIKNYHLIGKADQNEAFWYNIVTGDKFTGNFYIQIPGTDKSVVIKFVKKRCKINVDLSEKTPLISVDVKIDGTILWSEDDSSYIADDENFGAAVNEKAESELTEYLYKCSRVYKADINDFAKRAKKYYGTVSDWEKEDWQGLFEKADYNVNVKINIKREGINLK